MRYIGSKKKLLHAIDGYISQFLDGTEQSFADLFAGTNAVGLHFKPRYKIISNDILYFSHLHAQAFIAQNQNPEFLGISHIGCPIAYLNGLNPVAGYFSQSYSTLGGRMYFTEENAGKIDAVREQIEEWKPLLTTGEYAYLVSALIEAASDSANTTGTYGAFQKTWNNHGIKPLLLKHQEIYGNHRENLCFHQDANRLASAIQADIVYLDPPYNHRQYAANYHILENIARFEKPAIYGKSALFDWKDAKSAYSTHQAKLSLRHLVHSITSRHLILSYSEDGILSKDDILAIFKESRRLTDYTEVSHQRYVIKNGKPKVAEWLFYGGLQ